MGIRALAVRADPEDIESFMAAPLAQLGRGDYELCYLTITNGSHGTMLHTSDETARIGRAGSLAAAEAMGAVYYQGLVDRICALYAEGLLVRIPAVMRELAPETLVVHSPVTMWRTITTRPGWRCRRLHLRSCDEDADPLSDTFGSLMSKATQTAG